MARSLSALAPYPVYHQLVWNEGQISEAVIKSGDYLQDRRARPLTNEGMASDIHDGLVAEKCTCTY